MVNQKNLFTSCRHLDHPIPISVAKVGVSITATLKGNISASTDQGVTGVLEDVPYASDIPIFCTPDSIQQAGMTVIFKENGSVSIKKGNKTIIKSKSQNNLITVRKIIKPLKIKANVYERVFDNYMAD
ncbi:hypothetical protein HHI36_017608 [Cryptolaemus montrouzieri]|uniref:Uncharacterized protein n=1 Tax=Cryptolaemus montrouzieri TaxID=559131 RepID=A0ABD2NN20_9CUCU